MFGMKSSLQKEWEKLQKQEQIWLMENKYKKESKLNELLEEKVPPTLQDKLDKAFFKAFKLVFEKGTGIIEKTYNKGKMEDEYQINEFASKQSSSRKHLKAFSKNARNQGNLNTLISGASGVGLGVLGIGIPDIALFTGMLLKNVYQIALNYGFDYKDEEEKKFILLLIEGALSNGEEVVKINDEVNFYMENGTHSWDADMEVRIQSASERLSKELLYMKFLQGIPVVGAVGGAYDAIYMKRISKYAELKYRRRFYLNRM